jgi:hypothetical protein
MIQGVVDRNAFHLGSQYLSENRVRIVEANEAQISSAVIGNSGLYEQTIRLKDGHLVSKSRCAVIALPCFWNIIDGCSRARKRRGKIRSRCPLNFPMVIPFLRRISRRI